MIIREMNADDLPFLDQFLEKRAHFSSPLRSFSGPEPAAYQKLFYRSVVGALPGFEERRLFVSEEGGRPKGFLHLFLDFGDNLFLHNEGTIVDFLVEDDDHEAMALLLATAEKCVGDKCHFLTAHVFRRDGVLGNHLLSRGFRPECLMFIKEVEKRRGAQDPPFVLTPAGIADVRAMLRIGASQVGRILSPLRYSSEEEMREDYLKGHSFDWWCNPENFLCHLVCDRENGELLGFTTIELGRVDIFTGTREAHIVDLIFNDFSVQERMLAPLLDSLDELILEKQHTIRLLPVISHDRESRALIEMVERSSDLETIHMVKYLGAC
jgi:hypothetical protein